MKTRNKTRGEEVHTRTATTRLAARISQLFKSHLGQNKGADARKGVDNDDILSDF